jgi:hypothetical protein
VVVHESRPRHVVIIRHHHGWHRHLGEGRHVVIER